MYDIIRYIIKHNKLDNKIEILYTELIDEFNKSNLSKNCNKKMEKIHKMQFKAIVISTILEDYLSQDEGTLHRKRIHLFLFNALLVILTAIIGFNSIGIYKILSFILSITIGLGNIIGNKALANIIYNREDNIQILNNGITEREQQLEELREKYIDHIDIIINKIIIEKHIDVEKDKFSSHKIINILEKEYNITGVEGITFFDNKKDNVISEKEKEECIYTKDNTEKNEYIFTKDNIENGTYENDIPEIITPKTRSRKRIKRDSDK